MKEFIKNVYIIAFVIGMFKGFIDWLIAIFTTITNGDIGGFILTVIFKWFFMLATGLYFALVWGTLAVVILFLPYLLIRKLNT